LTGPAARGTFLSPPFAGVSADMSQPAFPRPFHANLATLGLDNWREEADRLEDADLRRWARGLAADADGSKLLAAIAGNSPYLGNLLSREIATVRDALTQGFDATFATLIAGLEREQADQRDTEALMAALRRAKRRASLLIAMADIVGAWPMEMVTGALSEMAETALRLASAHVLRRAAEADLLTLPDPARPCEGSGFIVLAMGKLGARELNYSSDIDLIVLYDDDVVQTPKPEHLARTFVRMTRDLVRIMDERTREGYVFRTDLRLRPDPAATPLAVSVSAAEVYYSSVGQNWERAAMIKARAVAGDPVAGEAFIRSLEPFVWRRNLDFAAIQDIHSIKRQINAHKGHRVVTVNGHDIKVGRGGIREIEFFAQTQQLIFGGREPAVRVAPTVLAMHALSSAGRVPGETMRQLEEAYRFLRTVEHRIQMVDDQQTHRLPETDEGVAHIAAFLGYETEEAFRERLLHHMGVVEDHYAELFEEAPPLSPAGNLVFTGTDDDPGTIETLNSMGFAEGSRTIAVISAWHRGRVRATRSARAREMLTELVPSLLAAFARTPRPDAALMKFDAFLTELPAGVGLFALLHANPGLLDLIAEIMGSAPRLAETLARNTKLLDAVLSPDFFGEFPPRSEVEAEHRGYMSRARDFEDALALERCWTNDQRFRAGVHMLRGISDGWRCAPHLATLAEVAVSDIAVRVEEEFALRHGRLPGAAWAIIAMGKLGSRQLTIASDIDLIVVYDCPPASMQSDGARPLSPGEYFIRLTQRLTTAITSPMADGRLYEVDMRLRPSGNAGPLAVSLDGFRRYQMEDAWTWEHMALTRARVIFGDPFLRGHIETALRVVLTRPRDPETLLRDVADMRRRIDKQFGTENAWDVKYARGGMIDIEFTAQYLQLLHAARHPHVLSADTAEALAACAAAGLIAAEDAETLADTLRTWLRIQGYLRLTTIEAPTEELLTPPFATGLARAAFPAEDTPIDFARLDTRIRAMQAAAHRLWRAIVEEPAERLPPKPQEDPAQS
jgi:[glutamine synthetase] adenylyltransferase / [glutamine synthetase]-adenylyl-L-tyrosine phosphorylase